MFKIVDIWFFREDLKFSLAFFLDNLFPKLVERSECLILLKIVGYGFVDIFAVLYHFFHAFDEQAFDISASE